MAEKNRGQPVPAEIYGREYFMHVCDGFEEFAETRAGTLPERLGKCLALARIGQGNAVLDLGCGRGEITINAARQGAMAFGTDYSADGLEIANSAAGGLAGKKVLFVRADAKKLPYKSGAFGTVFFIDTVEHLHPWEAEETMREISRVMKKGGTLVMETSPNALLAKPLYAVAGIVGLGRGPINQVVHVNEQSWFSLRALLKRHGFTAKVWLEMDTRWFRAAVGNKRASGAFGVLLRIVENRAVSKVLGTMPLALFFSPRLWATGVKG
ncbi:MAG: class I SAM-dependent methyltransferase [Candidatus Diapherotrites archaeon]